MLTFAIEGFVAPLAGAWIEIPMRQNGGQLGRVAPLAGAWIEMYRRFRKAAVRAVAPLAGAWIEIFPGAFPYLRKCRRTPRGCVD